jgi:hypothetical protein
MKYLLLISSMLFGCSSIPVCDPERENCEENNREGNPLMRSEEDSHNSPPDFVYISVL